MSSVAVRYTRRGRPVSYTHLDVYKRQVRSQGFSQPFVLDLEHLDAVPEGDGTLSLLAGIFRGCRTLGFKVEGFYACISTEVISAAGVSSSASFEMLICAIINHFFNEGRMSCLDYAKIGQYAEDVYKRQVLYAWLPRFFHSLWQPVWLCVLC